MSRSRQRRFVPSRNGRAAFRAAVGCGSEVVTAFLAQPTSCSPFTLPSATTQNDPSCRQKGKKSYHEPDRHDQNSPFAFSMTRKAEVVRQWPHASCVRIDGCREVVVEKVGPTKKQRHEGRIEFEVRIRSEEAAFTNHIREIIQGQALRLSENYRRLT